MKASFIIICFSILVFISCKKKVEEDYRPEFIGYWYCGPYPFTDDNWYDITIDKDSHALYIEHSYDDEEGVRKISGKARATNDKLKIGRFATFIISEYPHKIDTTTSPTVPISEFSSIEKKANWKMTIKSSALGPFCDGDYYKADY